MDEHRKQPKILKILIYILQIRICFACMKKIVFSHF